MFGSFYFETLYLQRILGYSPLTAGFAFLPITFALAAGSQVASRAVTKRGPRPLMLLGTAMAALGLAWLSQIMPQSSFSADLLGPFLLSGIGMGLSIAPVANIGLGDPGLRRRTTQLARTWGALRMPPLMGCIIPTWDASRLWSEAVLLLQAMPKSWMPRNTRMTRSAGSFQPLPSSLRGLLHLVSAVASSGLRSRSTDTLDRSLHSSSACSWCCRY